MEYIGYGISYLLEFAKLYLVLRGLSDLHQRKKSKLMLAVPVLYIAIVVLAANGIYNIGVYLAFIVATSLIMFDDRRIWKLLVLDAWTAIIVSFMDYMCCSLLSYMITDIMEKELVVKCIGAAVTTCVVAVWGWLANRFYRHRVKIGLPYYGLTLVVCLCNGMVITIMVDTIFSMEYALSVYIIFYLAVVSLLFEVGTILMLAATKNVYKEKDEINRQYLKMQEQHYAYLERKEENTRKFRHDVQAHMNVIEHCIENGKYEELSEYMEKVRNNIEGAQTVNRISVGCDIADAVINQYIFTADRENVTVNVSGRFPGTVNISSYDLCTIISNIIKNAIEAASELDDADKRSVQLEFKYDNSFIMINISNYYVGSLNIDGGVIATTKADYENHGLGLVNVGDAVANYNGSMTINTDDNIYSLHIILHNKQNPAYNL